MNPEEALETYVLDRLYGRTRPNTVVGADDILASIMDLLTSTVELRRGDSCLVMGPHGSGKTLIVEHCIEQLARDRPGEFLVVRLSGLALSDDKMAIREVSRQLDLNISSIEVTNEAETIEQLEKASLAATMQSILRLFDDAEYAEAEQEQLEEAELADLLEDNEYEDGSQSPKPLKFRETNNISCNDAPKRLSNKHVSVIFVVDGLERFATVGKQILLYNLLDLTQSSPLGVAVIGLTGRVSAGEAFEKRVRSRFSQRYYCVPRPRTLDEFKAVATSLLQINDPKLLSDYPETVAQYHSRLAEALHSDAHSVGRAAASAFYTTNDLRYFSGLVAPLVPYLVNPCPETKALVDAAQSVSVGSTAICAIDGISELELSILIAAARAQQRFSTPAVNLVLVQDEYKGAIMALRRARSGTLAALVSFREWSPRAVREAWEHLREAELVVAVGPDAPNQPADLRMFKPAVYLTELRAILDRENPLYELTKL